MMCFNFSKPTPTPTITDRSDASVEAARMRRLQLGRETGGHLATRLTLNKPETRFKLGS